MRITIIIFLYLLSTSIHSQSILKVHFLYGSTPKPAYKDESKWFGGKLGGHVGIESSSGKIFNFTPDGLYHVFQHKKDKHSRFVFHDYERFYSIFGGIPDSMKIVIITIPVSERQNNMLDSISKAYKRETPYDYAFFGMRCGAAAYDILAQLGVLPIYSYSKTYNKIFYPKKLRKMLLSMGEKNGWAIERRNGCSTRNWEMD